ncbi:MAG: hypothetical protein V7K97_10345 [Nostoc sp.]|uniref:hypothetical protein n=1 Tax=Nostoc sp. TaxID=1180 RepID=UPI002FF8C332
MKGFRKLSSIAMLLFAFVSPPSLAEAKDISLSNTLNEQSVAPDANLVGNQTGELLIAQGRLERRQIIRRREPLRQRQIIRRREQLRQRQMIRRREPLRQRQIIRRREQLRQRQIIRRGY